MSQSIGLVSILIKDYDEAIAFYVDVLGFALIEDTSIANQIKLWVVVAPAVVVVPRYCWRRPQMTSRLRSSEIKQVAAFSCFSTQTILNVITRFIKAVVSGLFEARCRSLTAQWPSLQTSTEINGT